MTPVALQIADGVANVTLDEPERGNAFDLKFCLELSRVATACDENRDFRAVLLDAAGPYFTVGADLRTMTRDRDALPVFIKNATVGLHSAISRFARMDAPVIVAVQALAVGGGVALCTAADFCLAAARRGSMRPTPASGCSATAVGRRSCPAGSSTTPTSPMPRGRWPRSSSPGPPAPSARSRTCCSRQGSNRSTQLELEARAMARVCRTDDAFTGVTEVAARRDARFRGR